jgi:hypothetical protein
MKYTEFLKIGMTIQKLSRRSQSLYELGLDLLEFENDYYVIITGLLKQVFNEKQYDWVDWFFWENDFGQKGLEARDEKGKLICGGWEELYKHIENLKHN